jgi:hypothetical protein
LSQTVLDSPFIYERYFVMQRVANLFSNYHYGSLVNAEAAQKFMDNNHGLYPYNPILSENEFWCKRVWKEVALDEIDNSHFGICKAGNKSESASSFFDLMKKSAEMNHITCYAEKEYILPMTPNDAAIAFNSMEPDKIILKEDYWYKRETGETSSSLIGLGIKGKNGNELWFYFPEVRFVLEYIFVETRFQRTTWDEVFKKQMYSSVITKTVMADGRDWIKCEMNQSLVPPNVELDALVDLKLIREDYLWYGKFYDPYSKIDLKPKTIELKCLDGSVISGQTENGIWQGEWKRTAPNGNAVVCCQFINGIPHGKFESYYPNAKIKESGNFDFGLRTGKWNSFFESGKKQSLRIYKMGVMDLKQIYYYENGQKQLEFFYHHGLPNGACKRWYDDGNLFESGELTDGIQSGHWIVNLKLTQECLALFNEFKDHINYSAESLADGILTFDGYIVLSPGSCLDCPGQLGINVRVSPEVDVYPKLK